MIQSAFTNAVMENMQMKKVIAIGVTRAAMTAMGLLSKTVSHVAIITIFLIMPVTLMNALTLLIWLTPNREYVISANSVVLCVPLLSFVSIASLGTVSTRDGAISNVLALSSPLLFDFLI
jgi:hypothetical protein